MDGPELYYTTVDAEGEESANDEGVSVAEAQRRKNGTVDKRQFLGDFDKEHLLGKTFGGGGDAGRR